MLKGLHHAGISVKDLDRSIDFYCRILGMRVSVRAPFHGEAMDRITKLASTSGRAAMLDIGAQHLELFEFSNPVPRLEAIDRAVSDFGISHFCIEVTDVQQEYERLRAAGVEFNCAPQPFGAMKATYARDPDGNVVELLELAPQ